MELLRYAATVFLCMFLAFGGAMVFLKGLMVLYRLLDFDREFRP